MRTVATGRHMRKDVRNPDGVFHWNGRLDNGQVAPDGTYYFRVALIHQGRTIDLTGVPVKVKTVPPHPVITSVTPSVIPARGRDPRHDPLHGQRGPRRDDPALPYGRLRGPAAGQELPDALEGPDARCGTARSASGVRRRPAHTCSGSRSATPRATPAATRRGSRRRPAPRRTTSSPSVRLTPSGTGPIRTVCRVTALPEAPGELAGGLPGRRRGLEVHRGRCCCRSTRGTSRRPATASSSCSPTG